MNRIFKAAALLFAALTMSSYALAEKNSDFASGLYLAPGINVMDIKDKFDGAGPGIKREAGANLSLGYQFDSPWAIEFMYQYAKPEVRSSKKDFKINYAHLDGLYTFDWFEGSGWAPYAVAGIGRMSYDTQGFDESDHTLNAGAGIKYAFTEKFHIRLDGRGTVGFRHGDLGASVNTALVYVFGKHHSQRDSTKKQNKPVVQQPVEEVIEEKVEKPVEETSSVAAVIVDSDGDGVPDHLDECADTAPGAKVDEKGCYILLTENHSFDLNVSFASGSSVLNKNSIDDVRKLAQFLTEYPNAQVRIEGHSDSSGSATLNKRLSQQRADAVKQSLIEDFGISESRVSSQGFGIEQPIADNATAEGRAKNRRVVAHVNAEVTKIQEAE